MRWIIIGLLLAASLLRPVGAQSGGQFCVRAFEDRNANAALDPGDPFLTTGLSANLLNENGIVIASALLDSSPTAAQGVICFQFLPAGEYSVVLTSPDYRATTRSTFSAFVNESGLPAVVEFGAERLSGDGGRAANDPDTTLTEEQRELLQRLGLALVGALFVMGMMAVLGVVVYWLVFRNSARRAAPPAHRTTGSMPAVRVTDTTEYPRR